MSDLTYAEVGATRVPTALPAGYRYATRRARLGTGEATFARAAEALRTGRMFRAAGLRHRATAPTVAEGVDLAVGVGVGAVRLWAPCRVVWVVDEPRRYGYGMGTLPGHPASGEEAFEVTLDDDDRVWFEVRAFSRPATWYTRAGGPVTRTAQKWISGRYVRGLRRLT